MPTDFAALAEQVSARSGQPLRVAVYGAIARAIRDGRLETGEVLPNEADLCRAFAVSRTVVRESLIMLEEDGLVRTHRGIGRFVADVLPSIGLEQLQPLEAMLAAATRRPDVRRLRCSDEGPTDLTRRGLGVAEGETVRFWESVVQLDGEVLALTQEWVPVRTADEVVPGGSRALAGCEEEPLSLLAALLGAVRRLGPGVCEVSASSAGAERADVLDIDADSPVLVLHQTVPLDGRPLYVGKHLIVPDAGHLSVVQS